MDPRKPQATTMTFTPPDFAALLQPYSAAAPQAFALYKAGFDTWLSLVNAALSGAERIRMTQLATDVETLGENHRAAMDCARARDVSGLLAVQTGLARAYMEGWMRYWSAVGEAVQSTQAEVARILSTRAAGLPDAAPEEAPNVANQRKAA
jgi:phasin family protein